MSSIISQLSDIGLVPVVKIERAEDAIFLADALIRGGLPCAEITFRTPAAAEAIRRISKARPDLLVGAGTVLTCEQADTAMDAGAKFLVSPGLDAQVVRYCLEKGVPILPGTSCPTDVQAAIALGLEAVKFFPAEAAGGLSMIKAMSAPYSNLKFMPTGGIHPENLNNYLSFPKIFACGGSWMVPEKLLDAGDFEGIERLTREAVHTMLSFELKHIGINFDGEQSAEDAAQTLEHLFSFEKNDGGNSIFSGGAFELMKHGGPGVHGHLAVGTNSVGRAVRYLKSRGAAFDDASAVYGKKGELLRIYLSQPIGGFAVHLLQK